MADESTLLESPREIYIEWTIKKFSSLSVKDGYYLRSPTFCLCDAKWCLYIFPNGETNSDSLGYIDLYLMPRDVTECEVQFTIGIKKADGSVEKSTYLKNRFDNKSGYGVPAFYPRSMLMDSSDILAPDDSLKVFCNARVGDVIETSTQTSRNDAITLSANFENLYISRRFSDATIVVQGREFFAHRNVLASRSTVFCSMFESDMTEKSCGRVEISDCDPDSFEDFLLYLYIGKFDVVSSSNAMSLYKTSDKYDLQELKEECIHCITSSLSVDSICDALRLATLHNEAGLLKSATEFFIGNTEAIIKTIKWQSFLAENVSLGNELFLKHLESKKESDDGSVNT